MHIRRLIYSKFGRYIISFILGMGLASLFRRACRERNCLKFVAPPLNKIDKQVFQYNNTCYKFEQSAEHVHHIKKLFLLRNFLYFDILLVY